MCMTFVTRYANAQGCWCMRIVSYTGLMQCSEDRPATYCANAVYCAGITLARLLHWELCSAGLMSRCNRGAAAEVDAIGEQQLKRVKQAKLLVTISKVARLVDRIRFVSSSHMTAHWACTHSTVCGELDETSCTLAVCYNWQPDIAVE